jgi:DNA (cytosine-5)-methyltransferase 1
VRFGSVCSGIEAASVAWHPLGWRASFLSEIETFPRAVLQHYYPDTPLHGDFTTIQAGQYEPIDLLAGGTPCQSFSVAGLRGGMADARGNLALEYLRLADRLKPRWIFWENVPGVLSSWSGAEPPSDLVEGQEWEATETSDFGCFLQGLSELGYGWAYRSLDAQYAGLAQRRERVFVVGYLGDWRRAAAVLFEPASLRGDSAPRRTKGKDVAPTISSRPTGGGGLGTDFDLDGGLIARSLRAQANSSHREDSDNFIPVAFGGNNQAGPIDVATACNAHGGPHGRLDFESETFVTHSLRADGFDASEDGTGRGTPLVPVAYRTSPNCGAWDTGDRVDSLTTGTDQTSHLIGFQSSQSGVREVETHATLDANNGSRRHNGVHTGSAVRRLTPLECARLQGFPDDYLDIPYRGKPAADGPRYKALGNSWAVPVVRRIGRRIAAMEAAR